MHTSSFSDGINTHDEIAVFAGKLWFKEICITDHSDATRDNFEKVWIYSSAARWSIPSYKNVHNDVKVIFWVEGDLLNKQWDACFTIQWRESEFRILSAHSEVYRDDPKSVTDGTIKAMEKYAGSIAFIWHPTCNNQFGEYYDLPRLIEAANHFKIPLELNGKSIARWRSDDDKVRYLLEHADKIYFNSDAHNLSDLREYRPTVAKMLLDWGYITQSEFNNFVGKFSF
jgi:histidinol phosphatase-like PHP family hydrolase